MAKSKKSGKLKTSSPPDNTTATILSTKKKYVDSSLASLFQSSAGPVSLPKKNAAISTHEQKNPQKWAAADSSEGEDGPNSDEDEESESGDSGLSTEIIQDSVPIAQWRSDQRKKKRKRVDDDEGLEGRYMLRLAVEEEKETQAAKKPRATQHTNGDVNPNSNVDSLEQEQTADQSGSDQVDSESDSDDEIPQHESLAKGHENPEVEKAARTVFLGNVSTDTIVSKTAKKTLLRHLASFLPSLPTESSPHKVESIRFRSTAYAGKLPKKASYMKRELMDATTKSTNAYAVYSTKLAAREAPNHLNGTIVLNRHIRVDQVAHPAKVDNRRCVFVGNLDFVDDDSQIREAANEGKDQSKQKKREPADAEEGLWCAFSKAGAVESVRVVRDQQTRVGKGFAYVQFEDSNAVEAALLFNDKKFPPMLPRKLRVVRAKNLNRRVKGHAFRPVTNGVGDKTMHGRAGKLLGRAGAAQIQHADTKVPKRQKVDGTVKAPEAFVFEGQRARSNDGKKGLNFGGKRKKQNPRESKAGKRAAAWRKKKAGVP